MQDIAVATQLQQWSFDKSRPERADSSASSPRLHHAESETLQIVDATARVDQQPSPVSKSSIVLQETYLSSEEDVSTVGDLSDSDIDDDVISIHDGSEKDALPAHQIRMSRFENGKSCDLAVKVSYLSAGRPKVIELASPIRETPPQRSASVAELPVSAIRKLRQLDQSSRLSLAPSSPSSRSTSPPFVHDIPRPSTGYAHFNHHSSALRVSDSSSNTDSSTRSSSPAVSERSNRPASASAHRPALTRSSLFISSSSAHGRTTAPPTPLSPAFHKISGTSNSTHSFLSSDPYESSTTSAASPILKSSPHKRLRSISQKLALAKIAITPSTKKWDSRVNGRPNNMPLTPATPPTPMTPMTAPLPGPAPTNRLRRNSRFSRPSSVRGPSPEIPPMPSSQPPLPPSHKHAFKLVARGANEREPTLELPPFPNEIDDPVIAMKTKKVRKRKSLMDLLQ